MNNALERLQKEKPELYRTFTQALIDNLGLISGKSFSTFSCPSCKSTFQIVLSGEKVLPKSVKKRRSAAPAPQKKSPMKSPLFAALVDLARLWKVRTGDINGKFKSVMKNKITKLDKKELRAVKIEWLKKEIAKAKSKAA